MLRKNLTQTQTKPRGTDAPQTQGTSTARPGGTGPTTSPERPDLGSSDSQTPGWRAAKPTAGGVPGNTGLKHEGP